MGRTIVLMKSCVDEELESVWNHMKDKLRDGWDAFFQGNVRYVANQELVAQFDYLTERGFEAGLAYPLFERIATGEIRGETSTYRRYDARHVERNLRHRTSNSWALAQVEAHKMPSDSGRWIFRDVERSLQASSPPIFQYVALHAPWEDIEPLKIPQITEIEGRKGMIRITNQRFNQDGSYIVHQDDKHTLRLTQPTKSKDH